MISFQKDDFEENLDDILKSVNDILNNTGEGFETTEHDKNEKESKNK